MDRYIVGERLGGGAFGVVFEAQDTLENEKVALKVLKDSTSDNPRLLKDFEREAKYLAKLNHPNVVKVSNFGVLERFRVEENVPFIAMVLAPDTLEKLLKREGSLSYQRAAEIAIKICEGLSHAHFLKVLHRDLKPNNILLSADGTPMIADFGISRALESSVAYTSHIGGTSAYMAPEQFDAKRVGPAADLYSLGITVFEMIAGERPFPGPSFPEFYRQHTEWKVPDFPQDLDVPMSLYTVIQKALEKIPENRFSSAQDMKVALEPFLQIVGDGGGIGAHVQQRRHLHPTASADSDVPVAEPAGKIAKIQKPKKKKKRPSKSRSAIETSNYEAGVAHYNQGQYAQAIKSFSLCIRDIQKRKNHTARDIEAYRYRSECFQRTGSHKKAIIDLDVVVDSRPSDKVARYNRGLSHDYLRHYDAALSDYQSLPRSIPKHRFPETSILAVTRYIQSSLGSNLRTLAPHLGMDPAEAARELLKLQVKDFKDWLRPWHYDRLCLLGETCLRSLGGKSRVPGFDNLQMISVARGMFLLARKMRPDLAKAHHGFGIALCLMGQNALAINSFDDALERSPEKNDSPTIKLLKFDRGMAKYLKKDYKGSMEDFRQIVKMPRTNGDYSFRIARKMAEASEKEIHRLPGGRRGFSVYRFVTNARKSRKLERKLGREREQAQQRLKEEKDSGQSQSNRGWWARLFGGR